LSHDARDGRDIDDQVRIPLGLAAVAAPVPVPETGAGLGEGYRVRGTWTYAAGAEGPCLDQLKADRLRHLGEDRHSRAKCGGLDVESILIDQALGDEGAGESSTSVCDDVAAAVQALTAHRRFPCEAPFLVQSSYSRGPAASRASLGSRKLRIRSALSSL